MEQTLGAFGDERLEKDPMRVDGGLTWQAELPHQHGGNNAYRHLDNRCRDRRPRE